LSSPLPIRDRPGVLAQALEGTATSRIEVDARVRVASSHSRISPRPPRRSRHDDRSLWRRNQLAPEPPKAIRGSVVGPHPRPRPPGTSARGQCAGTSIAARSAASISSMRRRCRSPGPGLAVAEPHSPISSRRSRSTERTRSSAPQRDAEPANGAARGGQRRAARPPARVAAAQPCWRRRPALRRLRSAATHVSRPARRGGARVSLSSRPEPRPRRLCREAQRARPDRGRLERRPRASYDALPQEVPQRRRDGSILARSVSHIRREPPVLHVAARRRRGCGRPRLIGAPRARRGPHPGAAAAPAAGAGWLPLSDRRRA